MNNGPRGDPFLGCLFWVQKWTLSSGNQAFFGFPSFCITMIFSSQRFIVSVWNFIGWFFFRTTHFLTLSLTRWYRIFRQTRGVQQFRATPRNLRSPRPYCFLPWYYHKQSGIYLALSGEVRSTMGFLLNQLDVYIYIDHTHIYIWLYMYISYTL